MKKLIQLKLKWLAKRILAKYRPRVIGITGSIGKTSAKYMIGSVLREKYRVRWAERNYNNELGLPLAIIDAQAQGKNIFGWMKVFFQAAGLIIFRDRYFPEIMVLEMGVDRPGDMDYLLSIVRPQIGVITDISESHLEYFRDKSELAAEKGKLAENLPAGGILLVNCDNEEVRRQAERSPVRVVTFGLAEGADLAVSRVKMEYDGDAYRGMSFSYTFQGQSGEIRQPKLAGVNHIYADLAAIAVGLELGLSAAEIAQALEYPALPRGRMNLIDGIKGTVLIDDTYNASPRSAMSALDTLQRMKVPAGGRRIAVLADMLELGPYSEQGHRETGEYLYQAGIDYLYTVGERSRDIGRGAEAAGMDADRIYHFSDKKEAGLFIQDRIRKGDIILIKGSRGMGMEEVVRELMAEPLKAEELLVSHHP